MINICYEQQIGDFFVPNGMPPEIVGEMKRLKNPKYVFFFFMHFCPGTDIPDRGNQVSTTIWAGLTFTSHTTYNT